MAKTRLLTAFSAVCSACQYFFDMLTRLLLTNPITFAMMFPTQGRRKPSAEKHPWNLLGHAIVGSVIISFFDCRPSGGVFSNEEMKKEEMEE